MPQRVSITAPSGRDAEVIAQILHNASIPAYVQNDVGSLISAIDSERTGAIVITEEAFKGDAIDQLAARLSKQQPWSDIPIILLALPTSTTNVPLQVTDRLRNVTVLERPLRPLVLVTAARAALRDRARQHDAARYIEKIKAQSDELRTSKNDLERLNDALEGRIAAALAERRVLADIVEGTDSFVQVADQEFRWLAVNRAAASEFEKIFGCRPTVGDSMLDTLAHLPEHRAAVQAVWGRALAGEEFVEQGEFGDAARERRVYEMKFNVLRDTSGAQIGAYQFVTDITERVAREKELADANEKMRQMAKIETLGQLTGGVAHDFNNLLTPIVGSLDILQRRHASDPKSTRTIAGAIEAADRATTLVQRLLAFARQQTLETRIVELRALLLGLQDLIARTLGPEITLALETDHGQFFAMIDPGQLELAVLNLTVNARDAMNGKGVITIELRNATLPARNDLHVPAGSYICLSVGDTGGGMEPQLLEKAIEPFFTTKGVGQGTGLGLSMVHGLAVQFGGALRLNNVVGSGMTAEIWLPHSTQDQAHAVELRTPVATGALPKRRVLLVDDDTLAREAVDSLLRDMGQRVTSTSSAENALNLIRQQHFDVMIADILMPDMRGDELAMLVRAERPATQVVLLTGHPGTLSQDALGVPLLLKPIRKGDLLTVFAKFREPATA